MGYSIFFLINMGAYYLVAWVQILTLCLTGLLKTSTKYKAHGCKWFLGLRLSNLKMFVFLLYWVYFAYPSGQVLSG